MLERNKHYWHVTGSAFYVLDGCCQIWSSIRQKPRKIIIGHNYQARVYESFFDHLLQVKYINSQQIAAAGNLHFNT